MFDIIIPVFKTPMHLLKQCLESVAKQTFTDYKIWVCDGTPHEWKRYDEMLEVFNSYENLEYVRQTGKGVSQARNQIIEMGSNPYVAFLDSDDSWEPFYLEKMMEAIERPLNPCTGFWFCEIQEFTTKHSLLDLKTIGSDLKAGLVVEGSMILQNYEIVNYIPPKYHLTFHHKSPVWFTGAIISRDALNETDLFKEDITIGEDTLLMLEVLSKGYSSCFVPIVGAKRNTHNEQLTKNLNDRDWDDADNYESLYTERVYSVLDDDIHPLHKEMLLLYLDNGKNRGITKRNCPTNVYLISEEDYEIETL